jgi:hypothetical protein
MLAMFAVPSRAFAQADEIQVYDGGLAPKGVFNLTWHNNFTPKGIKTPTFAGGVTPDRSFNGVAEWALGVTKWFEAGLYLPLYTHDKNLGWGVDGFKFRALFAVPNADERKFFYGANFELSFNANRWDEKNVTSEVRPIIGWHLNPKWDVIINPIVDTAYDGFDNLEFVPAARIAYNPKENWAVAVETYSDFGHFKGFAPRAEQAHQIYGVIDHTTKNGLEIEFGAGVGLTDASDRFTLKLILAKDLNKKK